MLGFRVLLSRRGLRVLRVRSLRALIPEEVPERLPGCRIYRNFLRNVPRKLPGVLGQSSFELVQGPNHQ